MNPKKIVLLIAIVSAIASFFLFDLQRYFDLSFLQEQKDNLLSYTDSSPWLSAAIYFTVYVVVTALSLPAAAVITLAGGALFGTLWGTLLVSFASTLGATLAFLMARSVFRDSVEARFASTLKKINAGVEREGVLYLFGLRLVPVFPFFAVNLLMGLTQMPVRRFFLVSQIGMLPGTLVYVNAGTQLSQIQSLGDIASPGVIFSFALLGIFPLIAKRLLSLIQARKVFKGVTKPKHFDTNMVVIGAGSAGLVTSYIAAAVKAKVTLIEKHQMGGDCLNTGCVPSKALIRSASVKHLYSRANEFGLEAVPAQTNFSAVMERVQTVINKIEPHDSVERYSELGVDCVQGEAKILDPYRVEVNGNVLSTKNIVIATGARPRIPNIHGLQDAPYFTSDTIWTLREQPKRFVVLGAGPIGCELAQSFARLGSEVSVVNQGHAILEKEDPEVAALVQEQLHTENISLFLGATVEKISMEDGTWHLHIQRNEQSEKIAFDALLLAVGRVANVSGFGLEELDIELNDNGTIKVNEYLQTKYPNIYACGDVAGPYQLTHAASHQAWYSAVNALFGQFKKFKADYRVIPWTTFTDPEVARVGLSETEAKAQGIDYEVSRYDIDDLDRAIADGEDKGFVKVLTVPGKDKILGAVIVSAHAGDLLGEFVLAMKHGLGLNKILGTIHSYPTMLEANKYLAGVWKRNHAPEGILKLVEKYHRWQRN